MIYAYNLELQKNKCASINAEAILFEHLEFKDDNDKIKGAKER
jgi:hypothetical protein